MKVLKIFVFCFTLFLCSCTKSSILVSGLKGVNESIQKQYAPDKRVAIYHISFDTFNDKIIVKGETNLKEGYHKLLDSLKSLDVEFIDNIRVLPDTVVGNEMFAVAKNSVINIRSKPEHSAELGTQGLLGMSLKVYDKEGDFYRIQTPDNYISWVDKGGIQLMNKGEFDTWKASKKVLFRKNFGYVYADNNEISEVISDISAGGLLQYVDENYAFYEVKYPDDRIGFIKKNEATIFNSWLKENVATAESIQRVANGFKGFPYLWGGTSAKGMDCSGFTKMVFLLNGFIIPRDASQQILAGKVVDKDLNFKDLQKGDLLFFGTKASEEKDQKEKVVHVGIWLGNEKMEFIHSSGNVHTSSMNDSLPNFDEMNKNRYLGSRRYLGIKDKNIIDLKEKIKL